MEDLLESFNVGNIPKDAKYFGLYHMKLGVPCKVKSIKNYESETSAGPCMEVIFLDSLDGLWKTYFEDEKKFFCSDERCNVLSEKFQTGNPMYMVPYQVGRKRSVFFVPNGVYI